MDYGATYLKLINRAILEARSKGGGIYYEQHHIVPKCLGGTNDKNNLVLLTGKEHFIAHLLLHRQYPNNCKLKIALVAMCNLKNKHIDGRFTVSSRTYEYARQLLSNIMQERMRGKIHSEELKIKWSLNRKGKPSHRKGKKLSEEHKAKLKKTDEQRRLMSDVRKGQVSSCKGRRLVMKGGVRKRIIPEEIDKYLKEGWRLGQKH